MSTGFPFFQRRTAPAALPSPGAAPPPPPAVAVVAPPPPPPVPVPSAALYVPRDPTFYCRAATMLAAALQPAGHHVSDRRQADEGGDLLARLLDGGELPKGYTISGYVQLQPKDDGGRFRGEGAQEPVPVHDLAMQREALDAARAGRTLPNLRHPPTMTEGQRAAEERRLAAAGPIPTLDELKTADARIAATLSDLSEGVRDAALLASCLRLASQRGLTGAPGSHFQEAVNVVISEIDRARGKFAAHEQPVRAIRTAQEEEEQGALAYAYPASHAVDLLHRALSGPLDESGPSPAATES